MLNCGLGILLIPACGVLLLIKGAQYIPVLEAVFAEMPGAITVVLCTALFLLNSMNDMAAPSVSLEGKSIWIPQSLPVKAKTVLRAKTAMHLILTGIPMLFTTVCAWKIVPGSVTEKLLFVLLVLCNTVFSALFGSCLGVKMANLHWTNEIAPIKQSGAVTFALLGGWVVAGVFAAVFFLIGYKLGALTYLGLWTAAFFAADIILKLWLDTKGARRFSEL